MYFVKQLTIRGFDDELEQQLQQLARQLDISLNKAAVLLLRKGAGLRPENTGPEVVGRGLDGFIGSWSADQDQEFRAAVRDLEAVDPEFWK